ncbi:hypothetical protein H9Y04_18600 [Streptomyces sp. TRM66268-LWL]|uniref:Secreted protein n=1 Tax=Streptomyces polyasparticus TaxID=2767826 RepID=A0ABR7SGF3_9ACTN|nr:hypothetical protein [Streptomyces polyasparticus]MBC9714570.1 hypothetical protein [Streptomyces polyasparticus]
MRRLPVLVMVAAGALALGACGTQSAGSSRTEGAAAKPKASASAPAAGDSMQDVVDAFTIPEALLTIEKDCSSDEQLKQLQEYLDALEDLKSLPQDSRPQDGGAPPTGPEGGEEPPAAPVPLPDGQGSEAPNPEDFGPPQKGEPEQWEKDAEQRDKCVFDAHTERVSKALKSRAGLTPDAVANSLADLGYPAKRVLAPAEKNGAIQFTVDLSVPFGPRCLSMGVAEGKVAAVPHHDYLAGDGIPESEERCVQRKVVP